MLYLCCVDTKMTCLIKCVIRVILGLSGLIESHSFIICVICVNPNLTWKIKRVIQTCLFRVVFESCRKLLALAFILLKKNKNKSIPLHSLILSIQLASGMQCLKEVGNIYIYIYICVCVCNFLGELSAISLIWRFLFNNKYNWWRISSNWITSWTISSFCLRENLDFF